MPEIYLQNVINIYKGLWKIQQGMIKELSTIKESS